MDALYIHSHSPHHDLELRYSLRSVHNHMPWVEKVWVFGDRPSFLPTDNQRIEHVSPDQLAEILRVSTPITNLFLGLFVASLIPELSAEFVHFADDYVLLSDVDESDLRKTRYVEDLNLVDDRGQDLWRKSLWNTFDLLQRKGYVGYNFETHMPTLFTKRGVIYTAQQN